MPGSSVVDRNSHWRNSEVITAFPANQLITELTNDPATLQTNFPGLIIIPTATNFTFVTITNVTPVFTNSPGPTMTNFAAPVLLSNIDLTLFEAQSTTNPAALQALYPQLDITSSYLMGFQAISGVLN